MITYTYVVNTFHVSLQIVSGPPRCWSSTARHTWPKRGRQVFKGEDCNTPASPILRK
jgi:hypothetical protein